MASSWTLFVLLPLIARGSIISTGTLQSCDSYQDGLRNCGKKLLVEYVIGVGQNSTDSIAASIGEIKDTTGNKHTKGTLGNKQITITFAKTAIYFYYPAVYSKTVNYQPWELTSYGTGSGSQYVPFNMNPVLNPTAAFKLCQDGDQQDNPACGWVKTTSGDNVRSSQGKCCKCGLDEMVFQQINDKRGGLQCSVTSKKTQSAHCMRMDPLWYHIYEVQAMSYWYQVRMTINSCPNTKGKAAAAHDCTTTKFTLDPSNTIAFDGDSPSTSMVQATLVGDYGSFAKAPDFENKYLAVPAGVSEDACSGLKDVSRNIDLQKRCTTHIQEGTDKWMLVDKTLFGEECNKIGVTYENFRFQSGFCDREHGSCTRNQLADYYDYDQKQADANKVGKYWLSSMSHAGLLHLTVDDGGTHNLRLKKKNVRLMFKSNRFQNTLIRLQIKATDVSLTTNVASGKIVDWEIRSFETGSNDGGIKILIKNTDTRPLYAQFILTIIECSEGVVPATEAGQAIRSLTGQQVMAISFNVMFSEIGDHTNDHVCTAQLLNAEGEKLDSVKMTFKTWDTTILKQNGCTDPGSSCGDAATGKASEGTGHAKCECGVFDFQCYTKKLPDMTVFHRCTTQITTMIITILVVVGCLIVLCVCCKVLGPKRTCQLLCLPFKCCAECCKCGMDICFDNDGGGGSGYRRYRSRRSHRRRHKKKRKKKKKKKKKKKSRHSSSTESDSDSDSSYEEQTKPRQSSEDAPAMHTLEIPLAQLAPESQDGAVNREEVYRYASYFDNNTTTVYFNIDGREKTSFCNMEGEDFSIRGVLTGRDGTFVFTVPDEDCYVTREMCNGELCELETPRELYNQLNNITLSDMEVYENITEDMKVVAINL